jgi:regulatory protein
LAGREHSRLELSRKLSRYLGEEGSLELLTKLLDEFEQAGWLSDQRFAEQWVERRAQRYGNVRIRQELSARGVQADLVDRPIEALENSEHVRAFEIWQRRYGGEVSGDVNERARQVRFLLQRGFSAAVVARIVRGQPPR